MLIRTESEVIFAEKERKRLQDAQRQSKIAAHQEAIRKLQDEQ